ncbi:hypothetical protein N7489_004828 [Penicillium chrysogenum]|uniref:uncharacterized protein n=1 Tax=Penicillium chrysogenum TaxID=5076 RepID=UPI0024DF2C09|nr:uncharacterized protein N7489_004828 [Penicillium chrysogenum]KAJ5244732.1 hypothetical protein N7489_004828 [Penicillium chrysogenum]
MSGRQAIIGFDNYQTEVVPLENAGLAQGSPLSPILFAFFNCDPVDQPIDFHGGASAFIDDYFRWQVGWSAERNLAIIHLGRGNWVPFAAAKTELIHITRKRKEQNQGQLIMNGNVIKPSTTAKLLGVIFNHELRWKEHVQQAVKRATKVNIALEDCDSFAQSKCDNTTKRASHRLSTTPRPSGMTHFETRSIYDTSVCTVQRAALIRVLSAFRTVATTTLDVEAHVLPTHLHLRYRAQDTITRLHTLTQKHPIWSAPHRAQKRRNNRGSFAWFPLSEPLKTMDLERLQEIEMIDPAPLPPWRKEAFSEIEIE